MIFLQFCQSIQIINNSYFIISCDLLNHMYKFYETRKCNNIIWRCKTIFSNTSSIYIIHVSVVKEISNLNLLRKSLK